VQYGCINLLDGTSDSHILPALETQLGCGAGTRDRRASVPAAGTIVLDCTMDYNAGCRHQRHHSLGCQ